MRTTGGQQEIYRAFEYESLSLQTPSFLNLPNRQTLPDHHNWLDIGGLSLIRCCCFTGLLLTANHPVYISAIYDCKQLVIVIFACATFINITTKA
jgi:hypothetical protein|tara:strand:- start:590 stop:874 length:285 start_codon:yes stop_codon:yes gene_type:complete